MRRNTVKQGLKLVIGGIVAVILATFYHQKIASVLFLSPGGEIELIYLGLFWGGVLGFCGILLTILGFFRAPMGEQGVNLRFSVLTLIILVCVFFILLFLSFGSEEKPRLRPGETITI